MQNPSRMFAPQQDEPHLRAIAMRDHDPIAPLQQVGNMPHSLDHGGVLVRHTLVTGVFNERVAARSYDQGVHFVEGLSDTISLVISNPSMSIVKRIDRKAEPP